MRTFTMAVDSSTKNKLIKLLTELKAVTVAAQENLAHDIKLLRQPDVRIPKNSVEEISTYLGILFSDKKELLIEENANPIKAFFNDINAPTKKAANASRKKN